MNFVYDVTANKFAQYTQRLELTPRWVSSEDVQTAKTWFAQLKESNLIPSNAKFDQPIKKGQPLTYKEALTAVVIKLRSPGHDQDADGYGDISLVELRTELVKAGVISEATEPASLAKALLSRKKTRDLKYHPPVLVPYGDPAKYADGKPTDLGVYKLGEAAKPFQAIVSIDQLIPKLAEYFAEHFMAFCSIGKIKNLFFKLSIFQNNSLYMFCFYCCEHLWAMGCNYKLSIWKCSL